MKSYIKLYGPPVFKAIKILEKIAIDMPEVCIYDTFFKASPEMDGMNMGGGTEGTLHVLNYFSDVGPISEKRCNKIISKSGEELGEYDFFFEWFTKPTTEQLNNLIIKIDEILTPLGVRYSITTK